MTPANVLPPEDDQDAEIIREFLIESSEALDQMDSNFVALEQSPHDTELLATIFRAIHTIKGTSGLLGFKKLEALAHAGEGVLSRLRDGTLDLDAEITGTVLLMVDGIRQMLVSIESGHSDLADDCAAIRSRLLEIGMVARPPVLATDLPVPSAVPAHPDSANLHLADNTVRVDVNLLDRVMNLVGELVLARNQLQQVGRAEEHATLLQVTQRLNLITQELQEGVMKTRMQPIANIWGKFPRVIRDLAAASGKQIGIWLEGKDTELDKTIIEAIRDPLTHALRNSADHGIELPAVRIRLGKPVEGRVVIRAFHEGGQVNIEISDDGGGIDPAVLKRKAVERGLVDSDTASRMTDRAALDLVFLPGFTTVDQVTNVSGRGVGMDVVRTNIEKIGGSVEINSRLGESTTVRFRIPLTLAVIPVLIVTAGKNRYAIPQPNLLELMRLNPVTGRGVEWVHGAPVCRLRGNLLPLVFLTQVLHLPAATTGDGTISIVVLRANGRVFGLVVDSIHDTQEIVVKPLGKHLNNLPIFAGATIMGDGLVALILDIAGLAQASGVVGNPGERVRSETVPTTVTPRQRSHRLLIAGLDERHRIAFSLDHVTRLEEFAESAIEWSDGREVVQYGGRILPLLRLADVLGLGSVPPRQLGMMTVAVYRDPAQEVGLVVNRIVDIVEEVVAIQPSRSRPGIVGSTVIQQQVTDVLDLRTIIQMHGPSLATATIGLKESA
ncbi:MAG: chemotaxis protein CheA [Gemmatimonadota bacterium]